jgi:hypothetical protein
VFEIYILNEIPFARHAQRRAGRALLVCQAAEHAGSRTLYYMLRRRLYITLLRARVVTSSILLFQNKIIHKKKLKHVDTIYQQSIASLAVYKVYRLKDSLKNSLKFNIVV